MSSYKYWNNIEIERSKQYYIEDIADYRLLNFLENETNLRRCFEDALKFAATIGEVKGSIIDVGAGVAWTSALISHIPTVKSVIAVDFSQHRLLKIAPLVFNQLNGRIEKFEPILGDFMQFDYKEKFDMAIFCQSLYMFSEIDKALSKIRDLLVKGGLIIVACERIVATYPAYSPRFLFRKLKRLIQGRADTSGNNFYDDKEYRRALDRAGFEYYFQLLDYPLYKNIAHITAGNHFGIKK